MKPLEGWIKTALAHLDTQLFTIAKTRVTPMSFVVFVLTIIAAVLIGKLIRRAVRRYFTARGGDATGLSYALERMIQLVALFIGVFVGVHNVGIDLTALAAIGAMLSVGIGLGLQGAAQNFFAGVALLLERPIQKGDFIIVGDLVGVVDAIAMRATRVITRDGVLVVVPNNELMTSRVINLSQPSSTYRVRINVGVAYGSDTERVRDTLLEVANAHEEVLEKPTPEVFFRDFGDSSLDFSVTLWVNSPADEPRITSELRFAIDAAFRAHGIAIPFPQRDLHIKSGALGRAA